MVFPLLPRRIRELPLSIPWTLHWGENHRPERNWNREKSQHPQREALSPQARLWSGMETPRISLYFPPSLSRSHREVIHFQFVFLTSSKKKKIAWTNTSKSRWHQRDIFAISPSERFSQHSLHMVFSDLHCSPRHLVFGFKVIPSSHQDRRTHFHLWPFLYNLCWPHREHEGASRLREHVMRHFTTWFT